MYMYDHIVTILKVINKCYSFQNANNIPATPRYCLLVLIITPVNYCYCVDSSNNSATTRREPTMISALTYQIFAPYAHDTDIYYARWSIFRSKKGDQWRAEGEHSSHFLGR